MSSWWSLIADKLGANYPNTGSAAQRVAYKLGAYESVGISWPAKIATKVGVRLTYGNWETMLAGKGGVFGSAGRTLYFQTVGGTSPFETGNITGTIFTDTDVFFTSTIGGSVGITGSLFSDTDSLYQHSIVGGGSQAITGSIFTDTDVLFTSTVTPGALNIGGTLFTDTDTTFTSTIIPGSVGITGTLYTDTDSTFASTVSAAVVALKADLSDPNQNEAWVFW